LQVVDDSDVVDSVFLCETVFLPEDVHEGLLLKMSELWCA
jgi:hypothetical protein